MSKALYSVGGLRFWSEREILIREGLISRLALAVRETLAAINPAFQCVRVETPGSDPSRPDFVSVWR